MKYEYQYVQQKLTNLGKEKKERPAMKFGNVSPDKQWVVYAKNYNLYMMSNADYERIQKKTADFLEICCELGGLVGGLSQEDTKKLAEYGHCIGMAFQITDDLLDVTGDEERIGKPAGNDIRQGVVTLPVIRALETSLERDELRGIVTNREMTDDMVARAIEIVRASDGVAVAQARADEYLEEARRVLPETVGGEAREAFLKAAAYIGQRDF